MGVFGVFIGNIGAIDAKKIIKDEIIKAVEEWQNL